MTDAPQEPTPETSNYRSVPPTFAGPATAAEAPEPNGRKRVGTVGVVAALAVGAVVGGIAGGGVVGIWSANNDRSSTTATSSSPASITVNDRQNATTITAVAAKASPSVVTISVTGSNSAGTGSGIVLTADGYVVTNTHVVTLDGAAANSQVRVETNDGRLLNAKLVGTDPIDDLAVIKVQGVSNLQPAEWADSTKLNVGDTAIAIGAPLGLAGTVTNGIVSALNRSITVASSAVPKDSGDGGSAPDPSNPFGFQFDVPGQNQQSQASATIALSVIQTDAAINPGNSGGALLDSDGKVIGVNVAIASAGGASSSGAQSGSIGVGFAIPANVAKRVADSIIKDGTASHGLLGASVQDVTEDSAQKNAKTVGASIAQVSSGGAASRAGLRPGDVITSFNGIPITGKTDLTAQVRALPAGSKASVSYVRGGNSSKVTVTLGELKQ